MIRKRIGAPCESGASVRCWHGGGKPTAAAWVSTDGWSNVAWLHQFRRLRVRWERRAEIHEALLDIGCILICWNHLKKVC